MTVSQIPSGLSARLCERELEILRLLARGHTAKSIANRLNRSEASVNERLREARRKTGIGSSRELARLLAAQKIWDENIDLPPHSGRADPAPMPTHRGFGFAKGRLFMSLAISALAAGLVFTLTGPGDTADRAAPEAGAELTAAASPLVGRWALDVARIPANERPRSVTIGFAKGRDGRWTTEVEIVAADGTTTFARSTAAPDGQSVPVTGSMAFLDSASLRQPAPNTLVMTLGKQGAPLSTRVYTVAEDGRSMTETIIWAVGGIPGLETTHFTRTG